uniref:WW domain binding protein 11 n=1 Tax=Ficedula albicollis TaxID=59894 RepID=A0A803VWT8_FICAL
MGRRSTSSTKSGKFMNPTDQARKEARKRELKKNKKQRMMVRAAVLKMKDPKQIIRDMEKLDEMEFNPVQQPQLNEKVLKDKRKKLRETFERILRLYEKENPDIYKELRKLEVEYEQKRAQLSQYFDAVKVVLSVFQSCHCGSVFSSLIRCDNYRIYMSSASCGRYEILICIVPQIRAFQRGQCGGCQVTVSDTLISFNMKGGKGNLCCKSTVSAFCFLY